MTDIVCDVNSYDDESLKSCLECFGSMVGGVVTDVKVKSFKLFTPLPPNQFT